VADQRDELALRDAQVDVAQGDELAVFRVEGLADAFDADEFFHDGSPVAAVQVFS